MIREKLNPKKIPHVSPLPLAGEGAGVRVFSLFRFLVVNVLDFYTLTPCPSPASGKGE